MQKKVFLITGSNSGLGKETAIALHKKGHHVIMACRNMDHCEVARHELTGPGESEAHYLDLTDYCSIRNFVRSLGPRKIDVLINNAGVMGKNELDVETNHFGPYLLTRLLLPKIRERVIIVGSEAHRRGGSFKISEGSGGLSFPFYKTHWYFHYARSKLCNLLMTVELNRRLKDRNSSITAHCVSPGRVNTNIFREFPFLKPVATNCFKAAAHGAETVVYAATEPYLDSSSVYLQDCKALDPSDLAFDAKLSDQLWKLSAAHVRLAKKEDEMLWPNSA